MINRRFLIIEDHLLFAEALSGLLVAIGGYESAGILTSGADAEEVITDIKPDVILLDLNIPGIHGINLIHQLRKSGSDIPILVISMLVDKMIVAKCLDAGANGFLPKNTSLEELKTALNCVFNESVYVPPGFELNGLSEGKADSTQGLSELSARELEILTYIAKGLNNQQISEQLFISPLTVKTHRNNLLRKLGLNNTAALVRFASQAGLI